MNEHLEQLEPSLLWQHFRTFCDTPRPSWHEAAIYQKIEAWADARGLAHDRDAAGNLRICKPATPGHENAPGIVLQGHVDMVSESDPDINHDFHTDPIDTYVEDGWLRARGTTLGADNGIGAAACLAILDEDELEHGPLEALMTFAEEVSLVGAAKLAPDWLQGSLLLNLDTEEEGEVTIGCAGGAGVGTQTQLPLQAVDNDTTALHISVHNLTGGHSGIDINSGRASANRLLARTLHALLPQGLRLVDYDGGRMDNAITRAAHATISLPTSAVDAATAQLAQLQATYRQELAGIDAAVCVDHSPASAEQALSAADTQRLVKLLYALPFGVERMSLAAPGVVETSNNIGVVQIQNGEFKAQLMVRSAVDSACDALCDRILIMFEQAGFPASRTEGYHGWEPNPASELLRRFIAVHEQVTGGKPKVNVIHAGLECGQIGAKYPAMDMISFGPTIRGAHSPTERAEVATVERFYAILRATISDLATA